MCFASRARRMALHVLAYVGTRCMACARSTLLTEDEALRVLRILGSLHCYAHDRMVLDSSHATHAHQSLLTEDKALRVLRILGTGIALLCACSQNTGLDSV